MIEKGNDLKSVSEIVQNGNHFKITVTTGTKVLTNEFIVGQETDVQTPTGAKMKAIINLEGTNKLVLKAENVTSITELTGDRLVNVSQMRCLREAKTSAEFLKLSKTETISK
uniref:Fatty acid-binding protein 1, liver-like protein n=1 Tax=Callorhinchus milii TaxID=7868 RepID=V9LHL3_CALMI